MSEKTRLTPQLADATYTYSLVIESTHECKVHGPYGSKTARMKGMCGGPRCTNMLIFRESSWAMVVTNCQFLLSLAKIQKFIRALTLWESGSENVLKNEKENEKENLYKTKKPPPLREGPNETIEKSWTCVNFLYFIKYWIREWMSNLSTLKSIIQ